MQYQDFNSDEQLSSQEEIENVDYINPLENRQQHQYEDINNEGQLSSQEEFNDIDYIDHTDERQQQQSYYQPYHYPYPYPRPRPRPRPPYYYPPYYPPYYYPPHYPYYPYYPSYGYQYPQRHFDSTDLLYEDQFEYQQGTGTELSETIYHDEPGSRQQGMKLLLDQPFTYGWSHSGVQSWGGNWQQNAVNQAAEQIRNSIGMMVNLKQLESFTKKDLKSALDVAGATSKISSSMKIGWKQDKSSTEQTNWVNQNNLLIDVSDVRIVPGTAWSKTEVNWKGERKWKASATMQYRLRIWGKA
ncbi:hypothetical protein [Metabacillus fastidiosus]|uniref:hypothetical protein n=1 Tax=Metabacillus fastidiosus TaxID=1458 RepID=UPI003D2D9661